jgi:hypothetical protein
MRDTIVTMPPDVVLILASSTVFVKASSLVNRDLAGMLCVALEAQRLFNGVWASTATVALEKVPQGRSVCSTLPRAVDARDRNTETIEGVTTGTFKSRDEGVSIEAWEQNQSQSRSENERLDSKAGISSTMQEATFTFFGARSGALPYQRKLRPIRFRCGAPFSVRF